MTETVIQMYRERAAPGRAYSLSERDLAANMTKQNSLSRKENYVIVGDADLKN